MVGENRFTFCPLRIKENIDFLNHAFSEKRMSWTLILKMFEGNIPEEFFSCLGNLGVDSVGSDNLNHLQFFKTNYPEILTWYLNYDATENLRECVDLNLTHKEPATFQTSCLMLELDPDRHGIKVEELKESIDRYHYLGAYLDCSRLPLESFFKKWASLKIPESTIQSLGTSVSFPLLDEMADLGINHFRIGELAFFGRDIATNAPIRGMRTDVFLTPAQVSYHYFSKQTVA